MKILPTMGGGLVVVMGMGKGILHPPTHFVILTY